jgi:23S rRNA (uracil1939-C5)-methyltransferase
MTGDTVRVVVERLGLKGDGIATGPLFVPLTLPGEEVEGTLEGDRLVAPRILTPSADRVRPLCPHYRRCGGCLVQHASDSFVADWKIGVVRTAMEARGLPAPIRRLHTSPPGTRRRATLSGLRTKSGPLVGFHTRASDTVVAIPDCRVLLPALLSALPATEALTLLGATRKGQIRLGLLLTESGIDVAVEDAKPVDPSLWSEIVTVADAHDLVRVTWNGEVLAERRPAVIGLGSASVIPPPGAFLQATAEGEAALRTSVAEVCGGATRIVDLFSGLGTFALPLAAGAEVHAVEGDASLLTALDRGWRHAVGLRKVTTETRDLFRRPLEPIELAHFDAAVIDPPRAGAEAQAGRLAEGGPARIAMVSCNPVTFARDAQILAKGGYSLEWIDVIDQFRWSSHVEIAAAFTRTAPAAQRIRPK